MAKKFNIVEVSNAFSASYEIRSITGTTFEKALQKYFDNLTLPELESLETILTIEGSRFVSHEKRVLREKQLRNEKEVAKYQVQFKEERRKRYEELKKEFGE